jgi:hypothetical protein
LNQKQKAKSKTAEQKGEQTVQDSHSDMLGSKSRGDITTSPHLLAFYKTVDLIKLCRPEKKMNPTVLQDLTLFKDKKVGSLPYQYTQGKAISV